MTTDTHLFRPIEIRGMVAPHRLWVSPMCQYSAVDGLVQPWHLVHLGSFAVGRAGLIMVEATAVSPEGRISPEDAGLWNEEHQSGWERIIDFSHTQGVPMGIQLAHAGRKASTRAPFQPGPANVSEREGGWHAFAPSALAFDELPVPTQMSRADIDQLISDFADAAKRASDAGFDAIEIHAAHGYLLHQFLSPLSNSRQDNYGGDFDNRTRVVREVVEAVRKVVPDSLPIFVRISATDWVDGGWDLEQSIALSRDLAERGVDLIDVSSGGLSPEQKIALGPGYQMPFAKEISDQVDALVATVGLITEATQADQAIRDKVADVVLMGRQFLRDPRFSLKAAKELGVELDWPGQYLRARLK